MRLSCLLRILRGPVFILSPEFLQWRLSTCKIKISYSKSILLLIINRPELPDLEDFP
jgi:hypothetical protein